MLKIGSAEASRPEESCISQQLSSLSSSHPGRVHVRGVLREFKHTGVNGEHPCLVLEPLGRTFSDLIVDHEPPHPESLFQTPPKPWPLSFTRQVSKQLVLGLDYLHSNQIIHRDIQPGNILLALNYNIEDLTEFQIQEDLRADEERLGSNIINLVRKDGEPLHSSDPRYLIEPTPLHDHVPIEEGPPTNSFRAVLTDLGAASTFASSNDSQHKYPARLRAPEVVLKQPIDFKADIFSLGCVIFHIVTLQDMFFVDTYGTPDEVDDDHLGAFIHRLGPLPQTLRSKWPRANKWINEKGELLKEPDSAYRGVGLKEYVIQSKPNDMTGDEAEAFADFLKSALEYDPKIRADTLKLSQHSWLTEYE